MKFLWAVQGFCLPFRAGQGAPRQPNLLPTEPATAVRQLRDEGTILVPEFKKAVQDLVSRMSFVKVLQDLNVGSGYTLALDQENELPPVRGNVNPE